jgi:hypothetical protein
MMLHGSNPTIGLEFLIGLLRVRYDYDARGRISVSLADGVLPRFVLVRSAEGCSWRFGARVPHEMVVGVARLAGREPGLGETPPRLASPPERLVMIERLFAASGGDVSTRHEVVEREGVELGEIWTLV